jgi:predicted nucleic acid-binding protein
MMIVLDTNVVSELMRAEPEPAVLAWLRQNSGAGLYTTAVTVAEIHYGSPIDGFAAQIAAICRSQVATLATRNSKDFADTGIGIIDPWEDATH